MEETVVVIRSKKKTRYSINLVTKFWDGSFADS